MSTLKLCKIINRIKPNGVGQTKMLKMSLYKQSEALYFLWTNDGKTTVAEYTFPSRIEHIHPDRGNIMD